MVITLPLPHKLLSPNARPHHMALARVKKNHRIDAMMTALGEMSQPAPKWEKATALCRFYFKDKRKRDKDNALASLKSYFDGLADAGVVVNDCGITHAPSEFHVDAENPRVEIQIEES